MVQVATLQRPAQARVLWRVTVPSLGHCCWEQQRNALEQLGWSQTLAFAVAPYQELKERQWLVWCELLPLILVLLPLSLLVALAWMAEKPVPTPQKSLQGARLWCSCHRLQLLWLRCCQNCLGRPPWLQLEPCQQLQRASSSLEHALPQRPTLARLHQWSLETGLRLARGRHCRVLPLWIAPPGALEQRALPALPLWQLSFWQFASLT